MTIIRFFRIQNPAYSLPSFYMRKIEVVLY
jgi:hypothetical protein